MYKRFISNPVFINNANILYDNSMKILGTDFTRKIIKSTFYKQYIAGEDIKELNTLITDLKYKNIHPIIDYFSKSKNNKKDFKAVYSHIMDMLDLVHRNNNRLPIYVVLKLSSLFKDEVLTNPNTHFINNSFDNYLYRGSINVNNVDGNIKSIIMLKNIVERARENGIRIMIDAENSRIQSNIDLITLNLQKEYNSIFIPVVSNTYQCYLKGIYYKINKDIDWCIRNNIAFGCKLVRGGYLTSENKELLHNNINDTHNEYNMVIENIITRKSLNNINIEVLISTHNQKSISNAINLLKQNNIRPNDGIYFAQLLGMADDSTEYILKNGYNTYKYLPYGKIENTIPYLIRRLQENRIKIY
jgi:proline dehydrogenase